MCTNMRYLSLSLLLYLCIYIYIGYSYAKEHTAGDLMPHLSGLVDGEST